MSLTARFSHSDSHQVKGCESGSSHFPLVHDANDKSYAVFCEKSLLNKSFHNYLKVYIITKTYLITEDDVVRFCDQILVSL